MHFFQAYSDTAKCSNLLLKPIKCVIVPIACVFSKQVEHAFKTWLETHIPEWKDFNISDIGKYLGFYLGPAARDAQWKAAASKVKCRTLTIAGAKAPTSVACSLYNMKVVGVPQFIGQLLPMPRHYNCAEKGNLHSLFHMPNNCLPLIAFFALDLIGGPKVRSIAEAGNSARFRTAFKTVTIWHDLLALMMSLAQDYIPTIQYDSGQHFAAHFDRPPFTFYMEAAFEGTFDIHSTSRRHSRQPHDLLSSTPSSTTLQIRNLRSELKVDSVNIQAKVQKLFTSQHMPLEQWTDLFIRRLRPLLDPEHRADLHQVPWHDVYAIMNILGQHHAMTMIKTYAGGWCTARRFQKSAMCVFGCGDAPDEQLHYNYCPKLLSYIAMATGTKVIPHPLARLGLLPPSPARMVLTLIAYTAYHDLKLGLARDGFHHIFDAVSLASRSTRWSTRSFARDALDSISSKSNIIHSSTHINTA